MNRHQKLKSRRMTKFEIEDVEDSGQASGDLDPRGKKGGSVHDNNLFLLDHYKALEKTAVRYT
jgi:hypothetical protein